MGTRIGKGGGGMQKPSGGGKQKGVGGAWGSGQTNLQPEPSGSEASETHRKETKSCKGNTQGASVRFGRIARGPFLQQLDLLSEFFINQR